MGLFGALEANLKRATLTDHSSRGCSVYLDSEVVNRFGASEPRSTSTAIEARRIHPSLQTQPSHQPQEPHWPQTLTDS